MKKICLVLLAAVLTLLCVGACADSYHFADIYMILDVPGDTFTTQLTPENLAANESFIAGLGETVDSMKEKFTQQGIRLIAYDTTHGRTLVVTAVQDAQSSMILTSRRLIPARPTAPITPTALTAARWGISSNPANGRILAPSRGVS